MAEGGESIQNVHFLEHVSKDTRVMFQLLREEREKNRSVLEQTLPQSGEIDQEILSAALETIIGYSQHGRLGSGKTSYAPEPINYQMTLLAEYTTAEEKLQKRKIAPEIIQETANEILKRSLSHRSGCKRLLLTAFKGAQERAEKDAENCQILHQEITQTLQNKLS